MITVVKNTEHHQQPAPQPQRPQLEPQQTKQPQAQPPQPHQPQPEANTNGLSLSILWFCFTKKTLFFPALGRSSERRTWRANDELQGTGAADPDLTKDGSVGGPEDIGHNIASILTETFGCIGYIFTFVYIHMHMLPWCVDVHGT